jgi:hypothetical protein
MIDWMKSMVLILVFDNDDLCRKKYYDFVVLGINDENYDDDDDDDDDDDFVVVVVVVVDNYKELIVVMVVVELVA